MPPLYYLNVTVHVLAAMLWLGGMFFLGVVGAPVLRAVEPEVLRQRLFSELGERFRTAGWWAIAVLVLTGTLGLYYRGWLHWSGVLGEASFWSTPTGHALGTKLAAVVVMIGIELVHDFVQGPRAARAMAGSAEAILLRRRAAWLARINALVGVLLVAAAIRLARGG
jgi:uncharacterized membrane protein